LAGAFTCSKMSTNNISAVIITLNEENSILRCLTSIADICDEILVIDSRSTDKTKEICEAFPKVRFIEMDWLGYSQTKNKGHALASHNWILSIDADECLDESCVQSILQVKDNLSGAYTFNRKNFYGQQWVKHGGWYPDVKVRLFDKTLCRWKGDHVHEVLQVNAGVQIIQLKGDIEHYTVTSNAQHLQTIHKYAKLAASRDLKANKPMTASQALSSAFAHFIKIYIIKLGFLDGLIGFRIARNSGFSKWLRFKYFQDLKS
jgi:glycosyltransferase involved in cell wall biosynthesis